MGIPSILLDDVSGSVAVEYCLLVSFIATAILVSVYSFGGMVLRLFDGVLSGMAS